MLNKRKAFKMAYGVKALRCENCCKDVCPNRDHTSIVKAALRSIIAPGNMDFILSPQDIHQLHGFCRECPEYLQESLFALYRPLTAS